MPIDLLVAMSARNRLRYEPGPGGRAARISVRTLPAPKLASTTGADQEASRRPSSVLSAAVTTIRLAPGGLAAPGRTMTRLLAGNPCCCSARHIAGSQDTSTPWLTCAATQSAACPRAAAAGPGGRPAAGERAGPEEVGRAAATARPAARPITRTPMNAWIQRSRRRLSHSSIVVASTRGQDGSARAAGRVSAGRDVARTGSPLPAPGGPKPAAAAGFGRVGCDRTASGLEGSGTLTSTFP